MDCEPTEVAGVGQEKCNGISVGPATGRTVRPAATRFELTSLS